MDLKDIHKSKVVHGIIIGIGIAIVILGIFKLGEVSGYRQARFSEHMGDNFNRNFVDPREGGLFMDFSDKHSPPSDHGAVGKIVSIALPNIVVAGTDNLEKTIVVGTDTEIRQFRDTIAATDLKVGDFIVVLGTPNDKGQVQAELIRRVESTTNQLPSAAVINPTQ